eukprot:c11621_g1_i1.p1 GENE.c11621_g1_i1~~c11621_g1_i1.p1  ORF type:complete len:532 (+),score=129.20 c11621_g1_i1:202-1596(+)
MMGKDFAEAVNSHLIAKGLPAHRIGVILANPDQSKHLETASMKVLDTMVDFVNLRSEEYSEHSRIPVISMGTPLQDALRRDFTINSLFYNINQDVVEDHTGQGIDDLKSGILRTPLPPMITFKDDPLRVLRAIRFAARFGFQMADDLEEAASSEEIHEALGAKITRERIGKEFEGMLKGPDPLSAFRHLHRLRLHQCVFAPPPPPYVPLHEQPNDRSDHSRFSALHTAQTVGYFLTNWNSRAHHRILDTERALLWLCGYLLPYSNSGLVHKNLIHSVSSHIVKTSLKLKNDYSDFVDHMHKHMHHIGVIASRLDKGDTIIRSEIGSVVRDIGEHWPCAILMAASGEYMVLETPCDDEQRTANTALLEQVIGKYDKVIDVIHEQQIDSVITLKPLVTGKDLSALLDIKPGKQFGTIRDAQLVWQMDNPTLGVDECKEWLKATFGAKNNFSRLSLQLFGQNRSVLV